MTTDRQWIIGCGFNDRHGEAMRGQVYGLFDLRDDVGLGDEGYPVRLDRCAVCYRTPVDAACDLGICPACVTRLRR